MVEKYLDFAGRHDMHRPQGRSKLNNCNRAEEFASSQATRNGIEMLAFLSSIVERRRLPSSWWKLLVVRGPSFREAGRQLLVGMFRGVCGVVLRHIRGRVLEIFLRSTVQVPQACGVAFLSFWPLHFICL